MHAFPVLLIPIHNIRLLEKAIGTRRNKGKLRLSRDRFALIERGGPLQASEPSDIYGDGDLSPPWRWFPHQAPQQEGDLS